MLENLRELEDAYQHGWILSTSQVASLLQIHRKVLTRTESLERHGFRFTRSGKIGVEVGWRVGKVESPVSTSKKK